jgi:polysaccharide biosynthesis/export protein
MVSRQSNAFFRPRARRLAALRLIAVALCAPIMAPANLWAQPPYGPPPYGPQTPLTNPSAGAGADQPFVSSPTALQPMSPTLVQCPKRGPAGAPAGGDTTGVPATSANGTPVGNATVSTSAPVGGAGTTVAAVGSSVSDSGEGGGAVALPGTGGRQPPAELGIEESFARLRILEQQTGALKQFGYSFFDSQFSGVANASDAAPGPDYVVGPDDTLSIQIWDVPDATLNRSFLVTVERDGSVYLPQVGTIPVSGLTMIDAQKLIEGRVRRLLKRFDMHMSVARIRTMKVFVVGEVVRPGAYEVSSLATASYGLHAACGPSRSGSLRRIRVVREGKTVGELDFYRFFLNGDRTQDMRLKAGDTLLVPPIGPVAAISGPVRRPGIYELPGKTVLSALIELAGGLQPTADMRRARIFRVQPGRERTIVEVSRGLAHSEAGEPLVQDGDYIRINAIWTKFENAVVLDGAVRNPGLYAFRPGLRLSQLVLREQLTPESYRERGEILRTDPVTYQTSLIVFSPARVLAGIRGADLELRRLDRVVIASQARGPETVTVNGEVWRPGQYPKRKGEHLSSLLERAGGFRDQAFPRGTVLVRPSVKAQQQAELRQFVQAQRQQIMAESVAYARGATDPETSATAAQENAVLQARLAALNELANSVDLGRVVVHIESIAKLKGSANDLLLEDGDQLNIPLLPQTVSVLGAVRHPSAFAVTSAMAGKNYIDLAGGPTEHGRVGEAYVLRPNGSTDRSIGDIGPGDTIIVPERIEPKTRTLPLITAVAAIMASLATTTLVIYVIAR